MLGATCKVPPLLMRRRDDATPKQGPIGRAVRKLTPRKSSFVNLLKGKGWNKEQDVKTVGGTVDFDLPQVESHWSSSSSSSWPGN